MKNTTILLNKNLPNQPVIIYENIVTDKSKILSDLRAFSGIYMFTHKESGKRYIGSAVDISKRLKNYFNPSFLNRSKYMYISRALLLHRYEAFSLTIFEFIDISNLSKEETRKLILEREQFYIDTLDPEYNILRVAGSLLGYQHNEETKTKLSEAHLGKILSATTKEKMSLLRKAFLSSGENHPRGMLGKTHSIETIALMREAKTGENAPRGFLGKTHSAETLAKMSATKGTVIYVYDTQDLLVNTFSSARKAGIFFECSQNTILKYVRNGKIFKEQWKLSLSILEKVNSDDISEE